MVTVAADCGERISGKPLCESCGNADLRRFAKGSRANEMKLRDGSVVALLCLEVRPGLFQ